MTEAQIQFEILNAWGAHPRLRLARINTGAAYPPGSPNRLVKYGVPGTADICGILAPNGRLIMIEVKSAKGKLRKAQVVMRRVIEGMGGLWITARSVTDVDNALAAIGVYRLTIPAP